MSQKVNEDKIIFIVVIYVIIIRKEFRRQFPT